MILENKLGCIEEKLLICDEISHQIKKFLCTGHSEHQKLSALSFLKQISGRKRNTNENIQNV